MLSKIFRSSLFLIFFTFSLTQIPNVLHAYALRPYVIYGIDNRYDVYESSDNLMNELARSTLAKVANANLIELGDTFTITGQTLHETGVCKSERFSHQLAASSCSGFLVSPDTLVTAGHCINNESDCLNHSWVFDYTNTENSTTSFTLTKNQVYHCTKILEQVKAAENRNDYAVLKLDRAVLDRSPLKVRLSGVPSSDTIFTVIGHPSNLPTKITTSAEMRDNSNPIFFKINADTYAGNSGSAVIDSKTGLVEGILVRGDQDYFPTGREDNHSCLVSVRRSEKAGRGEDVTRITNIRYFKNN